MDVESSKYLKSQGGGGRAYLSKMLEAMDGRKQAHTDVLVAVFDK